MADKKQHREPLLHVVKRTELSPLAAWLVRGGAILLGLLICGILSSMLTKKGFFEIYGIMFKGAFGMLFAGRLTQLWVFLQKTVILLCLSLAVTPAFKMKFWNCGAEGQALIGGLVSMVLMISLGGKVADWFLVLLVVVCGILAGALWGVIPAFFKAHFNTNETLFTLMMNYVATQITAYYVYFVGQGSGIIQPVAYGNLPEIGPSEYFLNILVVLVVMVAMYIYMNYSKQGYEISVVGESRNTARYIGIHVKKVLLRTMAISGAVCGLAGVLMVSGTDHSVNTNTMGGQGFTAIMVSWLGQFNPFVMAGMSALIVFLQVGAAKVADSCFMNSSFADIISGIVVLLLVGSEFFVRYSIRLRRTKKEVEA